MNIHVLRPGPLGTFALTRRIAGGHTLPGAALVAEAWEMLRDAIAAPASQALDRRTAGRLAAMNDDLLADLGLTRAR